MEKNTTNLGADVSADVEISETADNTETTATSETSDNAETDTPQEDTQNDFFGKPESYDYKEIELPENMSLNHAMTEKFNDYASKLNLSQKGATDLMKMAVELVKNERENALNTFNEIQNQKIEGYKNLLNTDKEIGGANLKNSVQTANLAYDTFFKDEGLRELLAESGLTVHPKFIKALKNIGAKMKEDKIFMDGSTPLDKQNREDILFPSMT